MIASRTTVRAQAQQQEQASVKVAPALSAAIGALSLFTAQQASAASEIAQLAKSDNRPLIIATLFIPVVGWVGFNILGPALNQAANMQKQGVDASNKGKRNR